GSHNGVLPGLMIKTHPSASVISAGRLDPENRVPGAFPAFQFGHPRKEAIDSLVAKTTGSRPAKKISFMTVDGGHHPDATPTTIEMEKAVYCTCWDGNIDVSFAADGSPRVEPLGATHGSGDTPDAPPPSAPQACKITPPDIFTPAIKPP